MTSETMWLKLLMGGVFLGAVTWIISYIKFVEDNVNDDHDNLLRQRIEDESQIDDMRKQIENQERRIRTLEAMLGNAMRLSLGDEM